MIAIMILFGVINSLRIQVGYVYLTEMMPKNWYAATTTIWCVEEGFIYVVIVLYL